MTLARNELVLTQKCVAYNAKRLATGVAESRHEGPGTPAERKSKGSAGRPCLHWRLARFAGRRCDGSPALNLTSCPGIGRTRIEKWGYAKCPQASRAASVQVGEHNSGQLEDRSGGMSPWVGFAKYVAQYWAAFAYRFNRRFDLQNLTVSLMVDAAHGIPRPLRSIQNAQTYFKYFAPLARHINAMFPIRAAFHLKCRMDFSENQNQLQN